MTDEEVKAAVARAIESVKSEVPALDFGIHERTTAHRLAVHMEPLFREWNVDCEYGRDGPSNAKCLEEFAGPGPKKKGSIFPDIIVHHRGNSGLSNNLLIVELKKNARKNRRDKQKLELLTDPVKRYQYQLGLYINIDGGNFGCTWYKDGTSIRVGFSTLPNKCTGTLHAS